MGRGLSQLQQDILRLAVEVRERGDDYKGENELSGDILPREVLRYVYRLEWRGKGVPYEEKRQPLEAPWFEKIDGARYNAVGAATSRALRRLRRRELIEVRWQTPYRRLGYFLTPTGWLLAEKLSVNGSKPVMFTAAEPTVTIAELSEREQTAATARRRKKLEKRRDLCGRMCISDKTAEKRQHWADELQKAVKELRELNG